METHSEFAATKYLGKEGKHHLQQWEKLKLLLNALPNGSEKTVKQWQTVSILSLILNYKFYL